MSRTFLGINPGFGGLNLHDPAAALVRGGQVVAAAEEERFVRIKGAAGIFPTRAVDHCLQAAGIQAVELSEIVIGYSPEERCRRLAAEAHLGLIGAGAKPLIRPELHPHGFEGQHPRKLLTHAAVRLLTLAEGTDLWTNRAAVSARIRSQFRGREPAAQIHYVEHHLAHAASAFLQSPFHEATIVVMDGVGEYACASAWVGGPLTIRCFDRVYVPNSLGYFYAAVTAYLGFVPWRDEGKVMALAPYGRRDLEIERKLGELVDIADTFDVSELVTRSISDGLTLDTTMARHVLATAFAKPPREAHCEITDFHRCIAWAAQNYLECATLAYIRKAVAESSIRHVCVAGGVFLNCKANLRIRREGGLEGLFVQPVCGDAGLAIGAALYREWAERGGGTPHANGPASLALGPEWRDSEVMLALDAWKVRYRRSESVTSEAAERIAAGDIVFWFNGSAEFGPRALGRRSILADPRDPDVRDRLNRCVKHREPWRPFAPAILEDYADQVVEGIDWRTPPLYMVEAFPVRPEWKARLPGVTHSADHTVRPQIVRKESDRELYQLIEEFSKLTGVPAVINTSLNDKGEPIVHSPRDAIRFFFTSAADMMVIGSIVIDK